MEGQLRSILRQKILDFEASPLPAFTRRDVHVPSIPNKAIAVIGMRRAGKTTFLWQVLSDRLAEGVPREGALYFNFDDERLVDMKARDLSGLLEEYYTLHPEWRHGRRPLFLFDEIQVVKGWEGFARRILDTEDVDLFVSGSSAKMVSREIATSMRGRAMEALVYPFSFREFLRHHGKEVRSPGRVDKPELSRLRRDLETYLVVGGFPEAQKALERDRWELLRGYVDLVLLRDVIERHSISRPAALRQMTRHLLATPAGLFSVNRLYNDFKSRGLRVSKDTLYENFDHLEDAFLVQGIWLATDSERRRMSNPRKVYPVDPGLIPVFHRTGRFQPSKALETAVCVDLLRRGAEIAYVRTTEGFEVDFLARWPGGDHELIQVCALAEEENTQERETRALLAARGEFPEAGLTLVTMAPESFMDVPEEIKVKEAGPWLLREDLSR